MPVYDKPVKTLMLEFVKDQLKPGQVFDKRLAIDWFAKHYPDVKPGTVQAHVEGMSVNSNARQHHPSVKPGSGHDLYFKVGPGRFRLWDEERDPPPIYLGETNDTLEKDSIEDEEEASEPLSSEFAFEKDLKNYLARNLGALELGLTLYEEEGINGIEFPVGGRFIDILALDNNGSFVVIELKVSRGYDRTIGQLLRYMAWVRANMARGAKVRGVIVASEIGDDLKLAATEVENVQLAEYEIAFKLRPLSSSN